MQETLRTRITVTSSTNGLSRISWEIGQGGGGEGFTPFDPESIELLKRLLSHLLSISSTGNTQED